VIFLQEYEKKGYLIDAFKIFRLKDIPPHKIPFHYHSFDKIILFLNGKVDYIIEGKSYALIPRDIVFVSHNDIHRPVIDAAFPYERIVIYISPVFLQKYQDHTDNLSYCFDLAKKQSSVMHLNPGKSHDLLYHMEKLENISQDTGFANGLYARILFLEFMILLNRSLLGHELEEIHSATYDKRILQILQYIKTHLFEKLTIDDLAQRFYLSKYYMMRKFKIDTGYSIHQYITNKRLLLARDCIRNDIPLTKLCFDCGFKDYSTFSRAFKNMFQQTPTEYKQSVMSSSV
jgi:AraC-like DNA-binding protein